MVDAPTTTESATPLLIQAQEAYRQALGRPAEAIDGLGAIEAEARTTGDWQAVAAAAAGTAWVMRELYRHAEATDAVARALDAARTARSAELESKALYVQAMIALELGQADRSASSLARAFELGGRDSELLFGLSVIADKTGDLSESIRLLREVLEDPACPRQIRLKSLNNLGGHLMAGDPSTALEILAEAARVAEPDLEHAAMIIAHNTGIAYAHAGNLPVAMAMFQRVEEQLLALGGPPAEHLLGVARVLGDLGLLPEARAAAAKAVAQLESDGGALERADALLRVAELARIDGHTAAATGALADARLLYEQQSRWHGAALVDSEAASLALELGEVTEALADRAAAAATRLRELGKTVESAQARWTAGSIEARLGRLTVATQHWTDEVFADPGADSDLSLLAQCRVAAMRDDSAGVRVLAEAGFRMVDDAATRAQDVDLRFRVGRRRSPFEQEHRQALAGADPAIALDTLLRHRPPPPVSWGAAPVESAGDLTAWRECERRLRSADFIRDAAPEQIIALRQRAAGLEHALRRSRWSAESAEHSSVSADGTLSGVGPRGLDGVVEQLGGRDLVALIRCGSELIAYTVTAGYVARHSIGPWTELLATLRQLTDLLSRWSLRSKSRGYSSEPQKSDALDRRIDRCRSELDPRLAAALSRIGDRVVVLADRGLDGVPWGAVNALFDRSVQVAALEAPQMRGARGPQALVRRTVLLGGGPDLAHVGAELGAIASLWATSRPTISEAMTAGQLLDGFGSDVVHIAAHGELRQDNPLFASLALADGPVTVGELLECEAVPGFLYLSSCWLGARPSGSPVPGVAAMLLQRGVGEIVASTAALEDASAPAVAAAVHRAIEQGASAADGLRIARTDPSVAAHDRLAKACVGSFVALV